MFALQNMIDAVGCCFFTLVFGTSGSMAIGLHNSHERWKEIWISDNDVKKYLMVTRNSTTLGDHSASKIW